MLFALNIIALQVCVICPYVVMLGACREVFMARAHGRELRGLLFVPLSEGPAGRFGRMFRFLPPAQYGDNFDQSKAALTELAETMIAKEFAEKDEEEKKRDPAICEREPKDENPTIPAGYTYLGQFIDHDITFDPVSTLQAENDPDALEDFRTPRLDLDSVYGRGPQINPISTVGTERVRT
jgi:hypothetical protein